MKLVPANHCSSGTAQLPSAFIEAQVIAYGQPVLVCEDGADGQTYLCSASVAAAGGCSEEVQFDPSLTLPSAGVGSFPSVTPVNSKVVAAASIKVLVPEQLLHSAVPAAKLQQRLVQKGCTLHLSSAVSCQVLDVTPAAAPGTVYRVVPSTAIQLTSGDTKQQASSALQEQTAAAASQASPDKRTSSSSSKSRSCKTAAGGGGSSRKSGAGSSQDQQSTSTTSSSTKKKSAQKSTSKSTAGDSGAAAAAASSGSIFDLLLEGADDE